MPGCGECPDFFELPVDGDPQHRKWVFWGANGSYLIGSFDGRTFTPESDVLRSYTGIAYAAQTWSNVPQEDGRRIQIAWMRFHLPGMPFNCFMSFPCELSLRTTEEGIRLFTRPVREIEILHRERHAWEDEVLKEGENLISGIRGDLFDIRAEFEPGDAKRFGFNIRGIPVIYDTQKQSVSCTDKSGSLKPEDGVVKLQILVDRTSIEIYGNDGRLYMPLGVIPDDNNMSLEVFTEGGDVRVKCLQVYELAPAWD